jgi:hypothetical protein
MTKNQERYVRMRDAFLPKKIKMIFIAESPPAGDNFFYQLPGHTHELLYRSIMKTIFKKQFNSKKEGLEAFAQAGYFLMDPIYKPVNKLKDSEANNLILQNYPVFLQDLQKILGNKKNIPLILIKRNICELLEKRLLDDGFNVVNQSIIIFFLCIITSPSLITS